MNEGKEDFYLDTENGSVKRGICESQEGLLTNIIESNIERINDKIIEHDPKGKTE